MRFSLPDATRIGLAISRSGGYFRRHRDARIERLLVGLGLFPRSALGRSVRETRDGGLDVRHERTVPWSPEIVSIRARAGADAIDRRRCPFRRAQRRSLGDLSTRRSPGISFRLPCHWAVGSLWSSWAVGFSAIAALRCIRAKQNEYTESPLGVRYLVRTAGGRALIECRLLRCRGSRTSIERSPLGVGRRKR
jgi:hypothetical protein